MTERIGTCVQVKRLPGGQSQVVVAGVWQEPRRARPTWLQCGHSFISSDVW
ncbi:MAG: hypothetical protein KGZ83_07145 [Sulfuricella sp.]|nr:hypothetical protein [Sulfuricella sp.]